MKKNILFLTLIAFACLLWQCGSDGDNPTPDNTPTIASFTPTSGGSGTTVTITGTNFSTTASSNVVKFNGTTATVTNATATSITTSVPTSATTGKITVEVAGKTATSANDFTVTSRNYTTVSIFAGSANTPPTSGNTNGTGTAALFNSPSQGVQDADGNIYVSDRGNNSIRRITPQGVVTLFAGDPNGVAGTANFNGTGTNARFFQPAGLAISGGNLYVAEEGNGSVRKITIPGAVVTTLATGLNVPYGIVADNQGNLFVGNYNSPRISKIVISTGAVSTFVGNSLSAHGDGTGTNTAFTNILAMCIDPQNNIYAVSGDRCVRKITPAGVVTTFVGNGTQPPAFVNSVSVASPAAFFRDLRGITIDPAGNLYVTQTNGAIRKITPQGFVTDFAGISAFVFSNNNNQGIQGDANGALLDARFRAPSGILCGRDNILYVFEQQRIRKIE